MQRVDATYTALISQPHTVETKLEVWDKGGVSLVHTFGENEIASLSTRRSLFSQNNPSVGGTVSGEIDCELYNEEEYSIPRMAMLRPYVKLRQEEQNLMQSDNPFYVPSSTSVNITKSSDKKSIALIYADASVDTYFELRTLSILKAGLNYTLSFDCSGIRENDVAPKYYIRDASKSTFTLQNGRIVKQFTLNSDTSIPYLLVDDTGTRPSNTNIVISNVKLEVAPNDNLIVETNPFYINAAAMANSFKSEDRQKLTLTYADPSVKANIQIQTTEMPTAGQYTLSFDCEGIDKNDVSPQFQISGTSGVKFSLFNGRISQTFTLNQDRAYYTIYMTETGARPSNTNIVLSNVKLEYGARETPFLVESEWIPKGVYWIDTRKKDYTTNRVQIHGYDAMLKGEQLFEQGTTVIDWPRTDIQVLNGCVINDRVYDGVAQKLGVTIQSDSLAMIDRGYMVQFPGTAQTSSGEQMSVRGAAMTVREVLSAIGAMYCGNWTIDEDGTMRFVQLGVGR